MDTNANNDTRITLAQPEHLPQILSHLREDSARHALVIQDLLVWPERSKFHFINGTGGRLSYAHISGHPASEGSQVLVLDGEPTEVATLLTHISPAAPFVVRETSAHLAPTISEYYPDAKLYFEQRMDVSPETFKPAHQGRARQLTEEDAPALAGFLGAPPQAAPAFLGWIKGSRAFLGIFEGDLLLSMGSAMVSIPEAWNLVSIETRQDYRGKGLATEVTSSLVERALQETSVVTLTVVTDNTPALRLYGKLGFEAKQERLWADCGAGSAP